jgi:hypothetical protein
MKDPTATRPDAKTILDTIVEAMQKGTEPFDKDFSLVPSEFDVELHPDAYKDLETIFPLIEERAAVVLGRELDHMNRTGGSILRRLTAWLKPARAESTGASPKRYKPAGFGWQIRFNMTLDPQADVGYIAVMAILAAPRHDNLAGPKTRRLTVRSADGSFETHALAADEPATPRSEAPSATPLKPQATMRTPTGEAASVAPGPALARLSFKDDDGPRTFTMTRPEIVVGRGGDGLRVDLQLNTLPDVSRQHLYLRYNSSEKTFLIKDVSSYGTTIDGRPLTPRADAENRQDPDRWESIPPETTIGLAGVLFIDFKSLL